MKLSEEMVKNYRKIQLFTDSLFYFLFILSVQLYITLKKKKKKRQI